MHEESLILFTHDPVISLKGGLSVIRNRGQAFSQLFIPSTPTFFFLDALYNFSMVAGVKIIKSSPIIFLYFSGF